jgi:hypothetical protein
MMFYGLPPVASLVEIPKSVGTYWSHFIIIYIYTQIHIYIGFSRCTLWVQKSCPTDFQIVPSGRPRAWNWRWGPWAGVVFGHWVGFSEKNGGELLDFNGFLHHFTSWMLVFPIKFPLKPPGESLCVWATVSCHCSFSDSDETKILKKVENDLRLFKQIGGVNTVENLGQVRPGSTGWAVLKMGFTNRLCCYYGYANLHAYSLENLSLPCNHLTSDAIKNSCESGSDYPRVRKRGVGKS